MELRIVHCDKCNLTFARHDANRCYRVNCGHQSVFVPGTNYDTLPDGWSKVICECGKEYPEIEFEEAEFPCKECEKKNNG